MSAPPAASPERLATPFAATPRAPAGDARYAVSVLNHPGALQDHLDAWRELGVRAADPNPFYEPWFLLPAMSHFGARERWRIVLVRRLDEDGSSELCGLFPFVERRGLTGLTHWTMWRHPLILLATPLIARGAETGVWNAVWSTLREASRKSLCAEFPLCGEQGAVQSALVQTLRDDLRATYCLDRYPRATLHFPADPELYLKTVLGGHHLRETRRVRRKLERTGDLSYRSLTDPAYAAAWADWFLQLEGQGWKAEHGTALIQDRQHAGFFRDIVRAGVQAQQLGFEGLFFNGEPIALKCNLHRRPATFAYKIAYDENYRQFSPGIQLELESLTNYSLDPEFEWSDSCAVPRHSMIERLWSGRRIIQHLLVSGGRPLADLAVSSLPLARTLKHLGRRTLRRIGRRLTRTRKPNSSAGTR